MSITRVSLGLDTLRETLACMSDDQKARFADQIPEAIDDSIGMDGRFDAGQMIAEIHRAIERAKFEASRT